ncbi:MULTISPECIES: SDR family NAD(P)-dependent oxidoreductase [Protofrankia]|uniref:SDR family NAD(P)-dependent oxidoreductase n=1 Tax=Protofrankia TaxID=2994361 RepID=UPI00138F8C22|nr:MULTISPECIES: SDR family NAD(P)-dependent oxidoreductase [Protofrankia]
MRRTLIDLAPLRSSPQFRRLWIGRAFSGFGSQMVLVAVMFQVWQMTKSTVWTGAVGLAQAVPIITFGLFAGSIIDRSNRRKFYLIAITGQAVCSILLAVQGLFRAPAGGRRGLGAALVDELLTRGARKVYATGQEPSEDPRPHIETRALQVRSAEPVRRLVTDAPDAKIIINNAGVLYPAPLLTADIERSAATFDINVLEPLRTCQAFAPVLARTGDGAIVNISSLLAWLAGSGVYGASQATLWPLTNSLRTELAPQHIQVLGVHAGFIDTDMVTQFNLPKTTPQAAATTILDGLDAGDAEVLVDEISNGTWRPYRSGSDWSRFHCPEREATSFATTGLGSVNSSSATRRRRTADASPLDFRIVARTAGENTRRAVGAPGDMPASLRGGREQPGRGKAVRISPYRRKGGLFRSYPTIK